MKKFGFTLAEVLVTMGIVGIIAAISAPQLGKLIPDRNKTKVLKAYNTITSINQMLLNNPRLYPGEGDCNVRESGFECTQDIIDRDNYIREKIGWIANDPNTFAIVFVGDRKYVNLVGMNMEVPASEIPNSPEIFADSNMFMTEDGLLWRFERQSAHQDYVITIDTNATGRANAERIPPNCSFDECQNPTKADLFRFYSDQFGRVVGDDPLTCAYLENPNNLSDRNADIAKARTINKNWHH